MTGYIHTDRQTHADMHSHGQAHTQRHHVIMSTDRGRYMKRCAYRDLVTCTHCNIQTYKHSGTWDTHRYTDTHCRDPRLKRADTFPPSRPREEAKEETKQ